MSSVPKILNVFFVTQQYHKISSKESNKFHLYKNRGGFNEEKVVVTTEEVETRIEQYADLECGHTVHNGMTGKDLRKLTRTACHQCWEENTGKDPTFYRRHKRQLQPDLFGY